MSTPSERVFRLIYSSHSRIAEGEAKSELGAIFTTARRNNRRLGVTGALVITGRRVRADARRRRGGGARALREHPRRRRHDRVTLLEEEAVDGRMFGRWAMAQVSEDGGPDIRLMSNADKGKIVATSPDAHVTPDQETVLGFMRDSITRETSTP